MDKKNGRPSLDIPSTDYSRARLNSNGVSPPQSPGAESQLSFSSTAPIYDPRRATVTSLGGAPSEVNSFKIVSEELGRGRMRTWESKKVRRLSACLVFFVVAAVVISALFVWREVVNRHRQMESKSTENPPELFTTAPPPTVACKFKAAPVRLDPLPESIQQRLDALDAWLRTQPAGALMANVVYMDQIIWKTDFGKIDPHSSSSAAPTSRTPYPIASLTKIITALMLYKLYDKEHVLLDDELKKYLPEFAIAYPSESHEIVLRELASQMAGMPREAPCYPQSVANICPYNDSVMIKRINKLKLVTKPGMRPVYSNLGFGLLGRVLAKLMNTTFENWVQENIFAPLGMNDSFFHLTPKRTQKIPMGTQGEKPTEWGWLNPAGGAFVSIEDLASLREQINKLTLQVAALTTALFLQLEIELFDTAENDTFLPSVIKEELFSPAYVHSNNFIIGTPWEMEIKDEYIRRSKNGYIYGYGSQVYLVAELKLALNLFWTGHVDSFAVGRHFQSLQDAFHDELSKRDNVTVHPPPGSVEPYIGLYRPGNIPTIDKVQIEEKNGRLHLVVIVPMGRRIPFQLNYLHRDTFEVIDTERQCHVIFMTGINHDLVHFNSTSKTDGRFDEFYVFGMHPRGKATYTRISP